MDKIIFDILNRPMLMEPDRFHGFINAQRIMASLPDSPKGRVINVGADILAMQGDSGYVIAAGGIAIVPVIGPMFKGYGSWGYADQNDLRSAVRQAASDPNVSGIMLLIDSPGGSVAGTQDLAQEIRAADAIKPVHAYIEDLGASAGYWTAASARTIHANKGAIVGSIGVVTALVDSSKLFENAGVKVIPMVTGKFKAAGMDGTPITDEQVAYVQGLIDAMFNDFVEAVAKGRGIRGETVRGMEAKVFIGEQAVEKKLIDGIASFDKAFALLAKDAKSTGANSARRAKARLQLLEMEE